MAHDFAAACFPAVVAADYLDSDFVAAVFPVAVDRSFAVPLAADRPCDYPVVADVADYRVAGFGEVVDRWSLVFRRLSLVPAAPFPAAPCHAAVGSAAGRVVRFAAGCFLCRGACGWFFPNSLN